MTDSTACPNPNAFSRPRWGRRALPLLMGLAVLASLVEMPVQAQTRPTQTDRAAARAADRSASRPGDFIVAVVNQELVTSVEVELRVRRLVEEAARAGQRLGSPEEVRRQVTEELIEERVILTHARENGGKVDEPELNRAVQAVAGQNQLTVDQLRDRLKSEGIDFRRFRSNLQEQLLVERTREREVPPRIRVTDADVDKAMAQQRGSAQSDPVVNVAQILVTVPEGASEAVVAQRRGVAEAALARVRGGAAFEQVAREVSEDANRERGGEIGPRPTSRLPDIFVDSIKSLRVGDVTSTLVRSGAGFHVLKVLTRDDSSSPLRVTQTRARHILLKPSAKVNAEQAQALLKEYRRRIETGARSFEDLARSFSEDGSAAQGGDLGWVSPGAFVPEFEEAMNRLAVNGLSDPVTSRFGVHLIQVVERSQVDVDPRQAREQLRNALREQKFEGAYTEWVRELRSRAYVEMREPPQ